MIAQIKDFQSEVNKAADAAFKSSKGGDTTWNQVLNSYSITPLQQKEKEVLLNSEMKIATGAFPIELRRVLQAIVNKHAHLNEQNVEASAFFNNFSIDAEVMKYHKKIKPFGGLSDMLKNATSTSSKYTKGIEGARQNTHRCNSCGAPRLEEMQYDECMFCGSKLFAPTE